MKRRTLLKMLAAAGCELYRHGKKHDIYTNPRNGKKAPVPRHTELANTLCKQIKKQLGIE